MLWYMPWDAMFFSHIGIIFRSKQLNIFDWAGIFPKNTHFTLNIYLPNTKTLIRICAHLFWQPTYRNFIGNTLDLRLFCIKLQSCYATTHVAVFSCSAREVGFTKRYCLLLDRLNSDIDVENIHESYAFCIRTIIWHGFEMWDTPTPPPKHHYLYLSQYIYIYPIALFKFAKNLNSLDNVLITALGFPCVWDASQESQMFRQTRSFMSCFATVSTFM